MTPQPAKSEISTALAIMGAAGFFASLLWSPIFVIGAIEQTDLRNAGREVIGEVVKHGSFTRKNVTTFEASIRYRVGNISYSRTVQGNGAQVSQLPLGTRVPVMYLPRKPDVSSAAVPDASSGGGIGWPLVYGLWGITVACLGGAWLTRKR